MPNFTFDAVIKAINNAITSISGLFVPVSRTITINGDSKDLSANRSWTISGGSGTVTSVGLSMPSAFIVANSPVTTYGTLAVTGAGIVSQYVRGDGSLANFPNNVGGGSSVSYYMNGSVNQGTFGGNTYYELSKTANTGAATNFTINANGYIANFITSAGDPALLNIPSGNWDFQVYLSASSNGGSPQFYTELYKYNGTTFTLISSGSTSPQNITNGTFADLYISTLTVPTTTLTLTDRLAIRIYVIHDGRTITLYTQDNKLAEVHTTFSTGIAAINGLTAQIQNFATGTSGTDFNINSATDTHTFNLPTASATNRGALSTTDWSTFNGKQNAITTGTTLQYLRGDLSLSTFASDAKTSIKTFVHTLNTGTNSVTGTTSETIALSILIPANTISSGKSIDVQWQVIRTSGTGGNITSRLRQWTTSNPTPSTANQLAAGTAIGTTNNTQNNIRTAIVKSASSTIIYPSTTGASTDNGTFTSANTSINIDWTVDQYFLFTLANTSLGDTSSINYVKIVVNG